jgi:hypothetical protein
VLLERIREISPNGVRETLRPARHFGHQLDVREACCRDDKSSIALCDIHPFGLSLLSYPHLNIQADVRKSPIRQCCPCPRESADTPSPTRRPRHIQEDLMSRDIIRTSVIRRTLVASAATVATALILTPTSAFAAGGGPGGGGKPSPKPAGPVQTTTRIVMPKLLVSGKALTVSAHVSPTHRGGFGTPAESGTVIITVDGTAGSPLKLAANKASEKVKFTAGKHTLSAKYSGDAAHVASDSGEVSVTVN